MERQITKMLIEAQSGDDEAFIFLVEEYNDRLFRLVRRLACDRGEAENIVQEAWLRAWQAIRRYNPKLPFFPWLARIAMNIACDLWRKRQPLDFSDIEDGDPEWMDVGAGVEQALLEKQTYERLREGLDMLRFEYHLVIALRYDAGLSYEEIAAVLNLPVNTVRTYLHRGKAHLRRWMEVADVGWVG